MSDAANKTAEKAAPAESPSSVESLSFEQALEELGQIVGRLEGGQDELDKSITDYQRGMALKEHCEKKLKEAQEKIEKIAVSADGGVETTPFEAG